MQPFTHLILLLRPQDDILTKWALYPDVRATDNVLKYATEVRDGYKAQALAIWNLLTDSRATGALCDPYDRMQVEYCKMAAVVQALEYIQSGRTGFVELQHCLKIATEVIE